MDDRILRRSTSVPYGWRFRDGVLLIQGRRWSLVWVLLAVAAVFAFAAWYTWGMWIAWLLLGGAAVAGIGLLDVASTASWLRYEVRGDRLSAGRSRFGREWKFRGSGREALRLEKANIDPEPERLYDVYLIAATPQQRVRFKLNVGGVGEGDADGMIEDWRRKLDLPAQPLPLSEREQAAAVLANS